MVFGHLNATTRGAFSMACFTLFEKCTIGKHLLIISIRPLSPGWYVVAKEPLQGSSVLGQHYRAFVRGILASLCFQSCAKGQTLIHSSQRIWLR